MADHVSTIDWSVSSRWSQTGSFSVLYPSFPEYLVLESALSCFPSFRVLSCILSFLNPSFPESLLPWITPVLNPSFPASFLSCLPPFQRTSFLASLLSCIPPYMHLYCNASFFSCILPLMHLFFPLSIHSRLPPFLHPSCPASLQSCIPHVLHPPCPAFTCPSYLFSCILLFCITLLLSPSCSASLLQQPSVRLSNPCTYFAVTRAQQLAPCSHLHVRGVYKLDGKYNLVTGEKGLPW